MSRKKAQMCRPDIFSRGCTYIREEFLEIASNGTKKGPNTPARFISTRMYVREQILRSHEMAQKRPKYAGPIYFYADVCQKTIFGDRSLRA